MIRTIIVTAVLLLFQISSHADTLTQSQQNLVRNVISDQLTAFIENDGERAYSHAAPSIKKLYPTSSQFMAMVERGYGAIYRSSTYDFGRNTLKNGQIFQELVLTDEKGRTWQSIYILEKQADQSWKINGVHMRKSDGSIL